MSSKRWPRLPRSIRAISASYLAWHGVEPRLQAYQTHVGRCRPQVVCPKPPSRGELRKLKRKITDALLAAGFVFDPENQDHRVSKYRGRYTRYRCLTKRLVQRAKAGLRSTVQIEVAVFPLRIATGARRIANHKLESLPGCLGLSLVPPPKNIPGSRS